MTPALKFGVAKTLPASFGPVAGSSDSFLTPFARVQLTGNFFHFSGEERDAFA